MKKKFISLFLSFIFLFTSISLNIQAESKKITGNEIGNYEGFGYELWKDSGTTSMTLYDNGTFDCSWSDINNALFRRGQKFDRTKTHEEIGNMSVEFGCDYQPKGNSYLCVYGWTLDPLVEFYVVDSWGTWRPPGATAKATITVDGGTYDIYETTRVEQPSIVGTKTFQQYWSVRTDKRTEGTISISQHFKEWEKLGMEMGKMYEVAFLVEGYQSSGTANVYKNTLNIGESVTPDETEDNQNNNETENANETEDTNQTENTDENNDISSDNNPEPKKSNISIKVGKKTTLKINNKIPNSTYKWTTSNKKVATVTKKGVVKGIKKGNATITCKITAPNNKFTIKYKIKIKK